MTPKEQEKIEYEEFNKGILIASSYFYETKVAVVLLTILAFFTIILGYIKSAMFIVIAALILGNTPEFTRNMIRDIQRKLGFVPKPFPP
jgi:hypothetical protein